MVKRPILRYINVGATVVVYQRQTNGTLDPDTLQSCLVEQVEDNCIRIRYLSYQGPRQWTLASFDSVETSRTFRCGPIMDRGRPVYYAEVLDET